MPPWQHCSPEDFSSGAASSCFHQPVGTPITPFPTDLSWLYEFLTASVSEAMQRPRLQLLRDPMMIVRLVLDDADRFDLLVPLVLRLVPVAAIMAVSGMVSGVYCYLGIERVDRLKHIRGRRILKGAKAVRKAVQAQRRSIRKTGRGIDIAPRVPISLETEAKHFLLAGASGGGKTQTLLFWIDQLLRDRAKILLHDTKGDMTAVPSRRRPDPPGTPRFPLLGLEHRTGLPRTGGSPRAGRPPHPHGQRPHVDERRP